MPIYEYRCQNCDQVTEFLQGAGKDKSLPRCKSCGSTNLAKVVSNFAQISGDKGSEDVGSCCGLTNPCEDPKRCCVR